MHNPTSIGNGVLPITCTPPADVPPTDPNYGTCLGAMEVIPSPNDPVPPQFLAAGLVSYDVTYAFSEYYWQDQNGVLTQVGIQGQTIDWAASEISQSGTQSVQVGVTRDYALEGKVYSAQKYTYLELACALVEQGVTKSASWVVRMKHF